MNKTSQSALHGAEIFKRIFLFPVQLQLQVTVLMHPTTWVSIDMVACLRRQATLLHAAIHGLQFCSVPAYALPWNQNKDSCSQNVCLGEFAYLFASNPCLKQIKSTEIFHLNSTP